MHDTRQQLIYWLQLLVLVPCLALSRLLGSWLQAWRCPCRYHIFFQALPDSADWRFGLCWGHAAGQDLVRWQHMPTALEPSKGGLDADGCFTGAGLLDPNGIPTVLYTGDN